MCSIAVFILLSLVTGTCANPVVPSLLGRSFRAPIGWGFSTARNQWISRAEGDASAEPARPKPTLSPEDMKRLGITEDIWAQPTLPPRWANKEYEISDEKDFRELNDDDIGNVPTIFPGVPLGGGAIQMKAKGKAKGPPKLSSMKKEDGALNAPIDWTKGPSMLFAHHSLDDTSISAWKLLVISLWMCSGVIFAVLCGVGTMHEEPLLASYS
eukprot:gnl/MRDRNA2_/MRDRNA2_32827_c0_seq1.p1 gnl/MRDRNA2_/MRDRNA2_32827_c0~~gnl/MRDRNA2_/MRDRNA2_32827_c0_seq1.p1  ORF type:complete len:212 (-),score=28.38 gnl/MRDRNA2_/MRDRNA2_32827_c0_seq1:97-732(-)